MHLIRVAAALIVLAASTSWSPSALADGITSEQADAILKELRAIRGLLERAPPAAPQVQAPAPPEGPVKLKLNGAYVLGKVDAPVTMVEFTDYECPFCRQFHMASFEQLKAKYIDTGKLRYVSRDFPLEMHQHSIAAAKMARCAGEQGRFWEMRQALIVNGNALSDETMTKLGRGLKLDEKALQQCTADPKVEKSLRADMDESSALGVSGTPTFVLGRSDGDAVEGARIVGALPYATFEGRIEALLAAPGGSH
jgi:protein-disulfide isomerase